MEDAVRIARRENNTKRTYLVVNRFQGKHIPVSPEKALRYFKNWQRKSGNSIQGKPCFLLGLLRQQQRLEQRLPQSWNPFIFRRQERKFWA